MKISKKQIINFDHHLDTVFSDVSAIASLSKVAAFAMPEKYYIFDYRVSFALNFLWVKFLRKSGMSAPYPKFCPVPIGRNSLLEKAFPDVKKDLDRFGKGERIDFYCRYCQDIRNIASIYPEVNKGDLFPHKMEMPELPKKFALKPLRG